MAGSRGHCLTLNSITDISETDRQRAFNATMTMKKIDVAAIKSAHNG
jgi:predicted 3-demethylubiquinone-9 3-methyltransferase (glyoxalase superfamily)